MNSPESRQQGETRKGLHPAIVIFGIIIGLWIFIQAIIPKSKDIQPPQGGAPASAKAKTLLKEASTAHVPPFKVTARIPEMNAVSLLVPAQTTNTQIVALLMYLRAARLDGTLSSKIPPTTPGNELDDFAIADIYIFSDPQYAVKEAIEILAMGAHTPGEFYSSTIPYEVAMEQVRGHYIVDVNNKTRPEQATLGFGEETTGVYSKHYLPLF
ncbi:MAG: hypothetical protein D6704_01620 [Nitrospirae bacterium]|nr:MAG: hypothetical protein D6704_01620 [Nitrospirota bacterium]